MLSRSYPLNGAASATVSHGYTFTPSSTESGLNFPVTASDRAGNVVTATFDVERDDTAPAVTVNVPSHIFSSTIPVSWTVNELGAGATGVYTVSVMTDTGPLQLWLGSVTSTSADFTGELGHRYTFIVTTTDNVSNVGQGSAETVATQVTKYYYIGSSRVAMRQGDTVTYLHTDHLGTVSVATNANAQVLARTLNLPYGGVWWSSGVMPTDWGFTGQREPIGTGLVYLHARLYSSFTGRFISADTIVSQPAIPQAFNRYSYVTNNPVQYIDPSGHCGVSQKSGTEAEQEIAECKEILNSLQDEYGLADIYYPQDRYFDENGFRQWYVKEARALRDALEAWKAALGGRDAGIRELGLSGMTIQLVTGNKMAELSKRSTGGVYYESSSTIYLAQQGSADDITFAHELAHAWERHRPGWEMGRIPSFRTLFFTILFFTGYDEESATWISDGGGWTDYAQGELDEGKPRPWEDFAETAAHTVLDTEFVRRDSDRYRFMIALMPGLQP